MPAAEHTWITNCIPIVHRDAKTILPSNNLENKKWKKPPMKSTRLWQRSPCTTNETTAITGHEILWDSLREILPTALQKLIHKLSPATPLWQTQSRTLQPPLLCLVSWLSNGPHWTAWNQPVGCSCQGGLRARLCWLQQLAQHSLPCIGFRRAGGTRPKSWCSCHSEHLHFHHFLVIKERARGDKRGSTGNKRLLVQKFIPKPHSEGKHWVHSEKSYTRISLQEAENTRTLETPHNKHSFIVYFPHMNQPSQKFHHTQGRKMLYTRGTYIPKKRCTDLSWKPRGRGEDKTKNKDIAVRLWLSVTQEISISM